MDPRTAVRPLLVPLILYERRSRWARHLRPLSARLGVRIVETRSAVEAARAASGSACPVVLVEDADPADALEVIDSVRLASPGALILAVGPAGDFARAARECGATRAVPPDVIPPRVVGVIAPWVEIARARAATLGWAADRRPEAEPWEALLQGAEPASALLPNPSPPIS